jgi:hypothetical protein
MRPRANAGRAYLGRKHGVSRGRQLEPMVMTSAEFATFIAAETAKWGKVIRAANIKVE